MLRFYCNAYTRVQFEVFFRAHTKRRPFSHRIVWKKNNILTHFCSYTDDVRIFDTSKKLDDIIFRSFGR